MERQDTGHSQTVPNWLTLRRLRDYPRLMGLAMGLVLVADVVLRSGWQGGLGQILGSDFITLYAAGLTFRTAPAQLYDFAAQAAVQQQVIAPTSLPGLNPFISPPYVAAAYSQLTAIPLPWAFGLWSVFSLVAVCLAAYLLTRTLVRPEWQQGGLNTVQLAIVIGSSFAFVSGLRVGQNHALTLLLVSAVLAAQYRGRWGLAGLLTGLLIYKPHFTLGLLVLWLAWGRWSALISFAGVAALWMGATLLRVGLAPFSAYMQLTPVLLELPYTPGFPAYLLITPYGLLSTLLPRSAQFWVQAITQSLVLLLGLGLYGLGRRTRDAAPELALAVALLYPLLVMPYALLHDALLLVPVLLLLARIGPHPRLRTVSAFIYLGSLFLPGLGYGPGIAWTALLPLAAITALWPYLPHPGETQ